jgi:hypothetical protein
MARDVATAEPHFISQQEIDDLRALIERHAETGEVFSYDPATRQAEVYQPKRSFQLVEVLNVARLHLSKIPVACVPVRREPVASPGEQGRRARRSSTSSRGSPDDPDPESDQPLVETWRGVVAASARMVQHCERRRAKWAAA